MPTYEYACTACGERLEIVQKFTDSTLTECPACAGALRKVFSPVGVVFKGSGFYKTDSRKASSNGSGAAAGESKKDAPAKTESTSSSGTDSKAAPAAGSAPKPADKPAAAAAKPAAAAS